MNVIISLTWLFIYVNLRITNISRAAPEGQDRTSFLSLQRISAQASISTLQIALVLTKIHIAEKRLRVNEWIIQIDAVIRGIALLSSEL